MKKKDTLYVVMPAYNEEETIENVVNDWYPVLKFGSDDSRLVIADSGSTDSTHKKLLKLRKKYPKLEIISDSLKQHGPKLIYMYKYAIEKGADFVFQTDSDGQTNPTEFENFWKLRKKHDVILGNRVVRGDGKSRKFVENVLCKILRFFFGVKLKDANAPFRLMSTNVLKKYVYKFKDDYNLPNVMLSTWFAFYKENYVSEVITFKPRQGGVNSINIKKITKIGWDALGDFNSFRKDMKNDTNKKFKFNFKFISLLFILAFVFSLNSPLSIFAKGESLTDSSVFRYFGMILSKGQMPYLDSFDHKGPLIYLINLVGYNLAKISGVWLLEIFSLFISFVFLYKTYRIRCNKFNSLIALLITLIPLFSYFDGGNLVEEYALSFICISLYIFIDYFLNKKISPFRLIICGLCFGAVCLLRINMCSLWLVCCFAVLIQSISKKEFKELLKFILYFLLGIIIIVLPFVIWFAVNNALGAFINDYIVFNLKYTADATSNLVSCLYPFVDNFVCYLCISSFIYLFITNKKKYLLYVFALYFIVNLYTVSMSGRPYMHYGITQIATYVYPIMLVISSLVEKNYKNKTFKDLYILIIICFVSLNVLPLWFKTIQTNLSYISGNSSATTAVSQNVIDVVRDNSKEDDLISVYGNWDFIYVQTGRLSASKYSYQFPISSINKTISNEYFEELSKNMPVLIVIQNNNKDELITDFLKDNDYKLIYTDGTEDSGNMVFKK